MQDKDKVTKSDTVSTNNTPSAIVDKENSHPGAEQFSKTESDEAKSSHSEQRPTFNENKGQNTPNGSRNLETQQVVKQLSQEDSLQGKGNNTESTAGPAINNGENDPSKLTCDSGTFLSGNKKAYFDNLNVSTSNEGHEEDNLKPAIATNPLTSDKDKKLADCGGNEVNNLFHNNSSQYKEAYTESTINTTATVNDSKNQSQTVCSGKVAVADCSVPTEAALPLANTNNLKKSSEYLYEENENGTSDANPDGKYEADISQKPSDESRGQTKQHRGDIFSHNIFSHCKDDDDHSIANTTYAVNDNKNLSQKRRREEASDFSIPVEASSTIVKDSNLTKTSENVVGQNRSGTLDTNSDGKYEEGISKNTSDESRSQTKQHRVNIFPHNISSQYKDDDVDLAANIITAVNDNNNLSQKASRREAPDYSVAVDALSTITNNSNLRKASENVVRENRNGTRDTNSDGKDEDISQKTSDGNRSQTKQHRMDIFPRNTFEQYKDDNVDSTANATVTVNDNKNLSQNVTREVAADYSVAIDPSSTISKHNLKKVSENVVGQNRSGTYSTNHGEKNQQHILHNTVDEGHNFSVMYGENKEEVDKTHNSESKQDLPNHLKKKYLNKEKDSKPKVSTESEVEMTHPFNDISSDVDQNLSPESIEIEEKHQTNNHNRLSNDSGIFSSIVTGQIYSNENEKGTFDENIRPQRKFQSGDDKNSSRSSDLNFYSVDIKYPCCHSKFQYFNYISKEIRLECGICREQKMKERIMQLENENYIMKQNLEKYEEVNKDHKSVKKLLESFFQEFGNKKSSYFSILWNSIFGKKNMCDESNISSQIKQICSYVTTLNTNLYDKENVIHRQNSEIENFSVQLIAANKEIEQLKKKFHEKTEQQKAILKERDDRISELSSVCKSKEIFYEGKIKNIVQTCAAKFQENQNEINQNKIKIQSLSRDLMKYKNISQNLQINLIDVQNKHKIQMQDFQRYTEQKQNEFRQVRHELHNLAATIKIQDENLESGKLNLEKQLKTFSKTVTNHCKIFSAEEIAQQAEKSFIDKAVSKIRKIGEDVKQYEDHINKFQGSREEKAYLYIKEMLIRAVEQLDSVESEKKKEILEARGRYVKYIQRLREQLEAKVNT